jgi:hypothetical protein
MEIRGQILACRVGNRFFRLSGKPKTVTGERNKGVSHCLRGGYTHAAALTMTGCTIGPNPYEDLPYLIKRSKRPDRWDDRVPAYLHDLLDNE